jgi:phage terminase large subunit GpA-like protein
MSTTGVAVRRILAGAIRDLVLVPDDETVTEWADKYRRLPETSTRPGPYVSAVVPYARRWQDLLADPAVPMVVMCWGSQLTKSTCFENAIGYRIHRMPAPIIVVQPKIDAAEGWAKERFVPMVRATKVLRDRVRLGRSSDSTMRYKRFPGGFLFCASAQSAAELASRSSTFILCDEVDRFEVIPGEGNPVGIVSKRAGAAEIATIALTSTPREAETSIIWPYLEGGTYELYHVPCPHCGVKQPLVWRDLPEQDGGELESAAGASATLASSGQYRLVWDRDHPERAQYLCAHCACVIDEKDKRDMLALGEWVARHPGAPYPSSHLNSLYSPFSKSGWGTLAAEWEAAHGKPQDLQVFVNTRLAELWRETAEVLNQDALVARANEPLEETVVPAGAAVLTAGVDVQLNRLEVWVWGWGANLESWPIAHTILAGDPQKEHDDKANPDNVWAKLDELLGAEWPLAVGGTLAIAVTLIDSGFATQQVYRYTKARRGRRVFASKGDGEAGKLLLGKPTLQGKERHILYPVGVTTAKNEFLRSQLPTREPGPGFVHLPDWLTTDELAQFVAEKRIRRVHKGRIVHTWVLKRDDLANEALDCRNYARAALELSPWLGTKVIARLGAIAEELRVKGEELRKTAEKTPGEGAPDPDASEDDAPPPPRVRGSWMRGF